MLGFADLGAFLADRLLMRGWLLAEITAEFGAHRRTVRRLTDEYGIRRARRTQREQAVRGAGPAGAGGRLAGPRRRPAGQARLPGSRRLPAASVGGAGLVGQAHADRASGRASLAGTDALFRLQVLGATSRRGARGGAAAAPDGLLRPVHRRGQLRAARARPRGPPAGVLRRRRLVAARPVRRPVPRRPLAAGAGRHYGTRASAASRASGSRAGPWRSATSATRASRRASNSSTPASARRACGDLWTNCQASRRPPQRAAPWEATAR